MLATAPARLLSITEDECEAPAALWATPSRPAISRVSQRASSARPPRRTSRIAYNHAVMGTFTKGKGRVFNAGCTDWAFGLDRDPFVQQVTLNIVRWLTSS